MRHHNQNRKFGRVTKVRKALLNSLARSLILRRQIKTTEAKAKELRPFVEKLITKTRPQTVSAKRAIVVKVGREAGRSINELLKNYEGRRGGYTRISKIKRRLSDGSRMAIISFIGN